MTTWPDGTIEVGKTADPVAARDYPVEIVFWGRQFKSMWSSDGSCRVRFKSKADLACLALSLRDLFHRPREEAPDGQEAP